VVGPGTLPRTALADDGTALVAYTRDAPAPLGAVRQFMRLISPKALGDSCTDPADCASGKCGGGLCCAMSCGAGGGSSSGGGPAEGGGGGGGGPAGSGGGVAGGEAGQGGAFSDAPAAPWELAVGCGCGSGGLPLAAGLALLWSLRTRRPGQLRRAR